MRKINPTITVLFIGIFLLFSQSCSNEKATGNTLLNAVSSNPKLSTFSNLVTAANLDKLLMGSNNLTLLVPENSAFEALPEGKLKELKSSKSDLKDLLRYHVLPGKMGKLQLTSQGAIRSLSGSMIPVVTDDQGAPVLGGAHLVDTGITASNGLVHIIDKVLIPNKKDQ